MGKPKDLTAQATDIVPRYPCDHYRHGHYRRRMSGLDKETDGQTPIAAAEHPAQASVEMQAAFTKYKERGNGRGGVRG